MGQVPHEYSSDNSSASLAALPHLKRCPSCSNQLPLHAFYTAGRSKTGQTRLHSHCKRCKLHREIERRAARSLEVEQGLSPAASLCSSAPSRLPPSLGHRNRVPQHESGTKLCTSCHCSKPLDRFYTAGRHKAGGVRYHSHCKSCKLGNEAALRMQPRKGSQEVELSEATAGLPAHFRAEQQPPATLLQQLQACADDSDSAVTWADRAGRGAEQTACTQSVSASHPEASGTQYCLHNSGQLSGRDVTSSHLPEAAHWAPAHSPQQPPASLQSPYAALQRKPSGSLRACELAQSPPELEAEEPHKLLLQMHAQQHEAEPLPMSHSGLPLLRWGLRKRVQRLFKAEPVVMASAAAVQPPAELAPAFIPRHSRKKGKVQRSAFE
ncbi:hypothetical protein WJX79_011018 [Trebouxia sp. C0005]